MKILIAQINPTPGDFARNHKQISAGIAEADKENCDLAIFPEMAIPGYLVRDLMYNHDFCAENLEQLRKIQEQTAYVARDLTVVVGYVEKNTTGRGKPFFNSAAVIRNGVVIANYRKQLLPFYDVFDEGRYFEPGTDPCIVEVAGNRFGLGICEDLFALDKGDTALKYAHNPIDVYGNDCGLIVISCSPFTEGKKQKRFDLLAEAAENRFAPVIYANIKGGQDELVFDGDSTIIDASYYYNAGLDDYFLYDSVADYTEPSRVHTTAVVPRPDTIDDKYQMLILGLRDYIRKTNHFSNVVVGSSGGIDSAVTLAIACAALGPKYVDAIMMPGPYSSPESVTDAEALHANLGCREHLIPIKANELKDHINSYIDKSFPGKAHNTIAEENIQARLRGLIVMHFANSFGSIALSTGNKTELALGYCTLYGDMNGGFNVLGDLYKGEVYTLAKHINTINDQEIIPSAIIDKAPSAELKEDQWDEDTLLPYPILDEIVKTYIENYITSYDEFIVHSLRKCDKPDYDRIIELIRGAEFKRRQAAPCIKLHEVAFGTGRRIPINKG